MKYKFVFPAIGAVVAVLGLYFPSGTLYGRLEFWLVGVKEADPNVFEFMRLMYIDTFTFQFLFAMCFGMVCTFLICVCCVFLVIFSNELKKKKENRI